MKKTATVICLLCLSVLISSESVMGEDINLATIVVTPSRIEESYGDTFQNTDVITSSEIETSGAQNLAEVLTNLTSVNISNYGGLGASKMIRMRGSTAAQVLVLIDSRPVNNPRDGETDLSTIALDNIDRIEIVHGPSSSLYGTGAMGGVVNIITKKPPKEKQTTELSTSFGSFRTYTERLSHGARISKLGYLITGGYETSQGFRDNSEFCAKDLNVKFDYNLDNLNTLSLNSGFYNSKVGAPGLITAPDIDDKQRQFKHFLDFNWNLTLDPETELSAKIYQNYDRLEFSENTAGSVFDTAFSKAIHSTVARGLDLQFNKQLFENYQLISGLNYVKNTNDSTSSGKHRYTVRAGYLENQLDLFKNVKINFGARIDDYSNFSTEINPSFSFLYKLNQDIKVHGLISRSFRAPTFNDLYWPDEGWIRGNPNLTPEKGITGELGMRTKINKYISSGLIVYRNDYNDLINWGEESGVWIPKNIDSAVIDGIEFENKLQLTDNLDLGFNYTFLKAKNDNTDKYLVYQPKHKFDCSLKYKNSNDLVFEIKGQFTGKRFHDPGNTIYVKRFLVIGLNMSKKINPGLTYFVSIDNLLNKNYQTLRSYPMSGFSITSGIKSQF